MREAERLNGLTEIERARVMAERRREYKRMRYREVRGVVIQELRQPMAPEQVREKAWAAHIRRTYGLTAEEYAVMHDRQGGVCAICGLPERFRGGRVKGGSKVMRLAIDHDHNTGKVRGLLCKACNIGIGTLNHDIEILKNAMAYLQSHL
jgi:hypothetical protein